MGDTEQFFIKVCDTKECNQSSDYQDLKLFTDGRTHILKLHIIDCIFREGISFIGHNSEITGLAIAGSSTLLSISADGKLASWNLQTKIR